MTFLEARNKILRALDVATDVFNDEQLNGRLRDPRVDLTFAELELDSLATIECCMALEDDISIDIDPADLALHSSLNKLAEYIVQRTMPRDP
jgi:Phosphopantetheine attachment site.